jgi:hypothetical protein
VYTRHSVLKKNGGRGEMGGVGCPDLASSGLDEN